MQQSFKFIAVCFVLLMLVVIYSTAGPLFHLHQVTVTGEGWVVKPEHIKNGLAQSGEMSLIHGDFTYLEEEIKRIPQVKDAVVIYDYPHDIKLNVELRKAIARAVDGGLIDTNGQWYATEFNGQLPNFDMARSAMPKAVEFYTTASAKLSPEKVNITQLHYSSDGWRVFLNNGWVLLLGDHKIRNRFDRFISVLPKLKLGFSENNLRFDLRYPHGMAVAGVNLEKEENV